MEEEIPGGNGKKVRGREIMTWYHPSFTPTNTYKKGVLDIMDGLAKWMNEIRREERFTTPGGEEHKTIVAAQRRMAFKFIKNLLYAGGGDTTSHEAENLANVIVNNIDEIACAAKVANGTLTFTDVGIGDLMGITDCKATIPNSGDPTDGNDEGDEGDEGDGAKVDLLAPFYPSPPGPLALFYPDPLESAIDNMYNKKEN